MLVQLVQVAQQELVQLVLVQLVLVQLVLVQVEPVLEQSWVPLQLLPFLEKHQGVLVELLIYPVSSEQRCPP